MFESASFGLAATFGRSFFSFPVRFLAMQLGGFLGPFLMFSGFSILFFPMLARGFFGSLGFFPVFTCGLFFGFFGMAKAFELLPGSFFFMPSLAGQAGAYLIAEEMAAAVSHFNERRSCCHRADQFALRFGELPEGFRGVFSSPFGAGGFIAAVDRDPNFGIGARARAAPR